jgi:predicted component of type VI protein secretion system
VETKATEPTPKKEEPKPAPVIAPVAAPVATPTTEPTPAKVETPKPEPAPQPEPVAEPAPEFANMGETQPDAPAGLSPDQEALKKVLSDAGFTFEDFNGWGRASSIPFMKAKLLMGYEDVPDEKAKFFVQHLVGVKAGITSYLNKK